MFVRIKEQKKALVVFFSDCDDINFSVENLSSSESIQLSLQPDVHYEFLKVPFGLKNAPVIL
jgi:hypothetical protein